MKELENLKVGDKVIVSGLYRYERISQVERVTKKYIFVESVKFSKAFGRLSWCRSSLANIKPATEEDIKRREEETEKRNIVNYLTIANFEKLSYETLVAIRDIVEKEIGKQTTKEIERWVARDKDDRLHVYRGEKPKRFLKTWSNSSFDVSPLPRQWFPEVQWSDDEPTKVKLVIEK